MILSKKETFSLIFVFYSLLSTCASAEVTLGILTSIRDNSLVTLNDSNRHVECPPFGIKPLEILMKEQGNDECSQSIQTFYRSHPHEKAFANEHLHLHQKYHYEQYPYGCVLYSNGAESYSEQLLNEGLAIIDPNFNQREWNTKLRRANTRAKVLKKGVYEGEIRVKCIKGEETP